MTEKLKFKGKIKTVDVTTRQWWDKYNGNTYFSARIVVNFGMKNELTVLMPFQYGYGSYEYEAFAELIKRGIIKDADKTDVYHRYFTENNIIFRYTNIGYGLKRDCVAFGQ